MSLTKEHFFNEINRISEVDDTDFHYQQYLKIMQEQQAYESLKKQDYQSKTNEPSTHIKEFKGKNRLPY
jgi:hypothetical protein